MPRVQPLATGPRFGNQHYTNHNQITRHRQMDFMRTRSMDITHPTSAHNIQPATHHNNSSRLAPLFHSSRKHNWIHIWERRSTFNDNRRRWLLLPLPLWRNRLRPRRRHLSRTLNRRNHQVSSSYVILTLFLFIRISLVSCILRTKIDSNNVRHYAFGGTICERYAHNLFLITALIPHNRTHFSIIILCGFKRVYDLPGGPGFSRVFQGLGFIVPLGFRV